MKDRDSSKQTTEGKASENKLQIFEMFLFIRDFISYLRQEEAEKLG